MDLEAIASFTHSELISHIRAIGLECEDNELSDEELQGLLYSFTSSNVHFDQIYELCRIFEQPFSLIETLLESNDWKLTEALVAELFELSPSCHHHVNIVPLVSSVALSKKFSEMAPSLHPGCIFLFLQADFSHGGEGELRRIMVDKGEHRMVGVTSIYTGLSFGVHTITLERQIDDTTMTTETFTIYIPSTLYAYGYALDAALDIIYWYIL